MRADSLLLCVLVMVLGAACGGADEDPDSLVVGASGTSPSQGGPLEAPVLEDVIPMSKVLRVRWSLPTPCDDVDAERRTDASPFAHAFTAKGTDTDHVDEDAHRDETFTYRLRCVRGSATSDYSNTLSGNPFAE
jgi:hypothetical protein